MHFFFPEDVTIKAQFILPLRKIQIRPLEISKLTPMHDMKGIKIYGYGLQDFSRRLLDGPHTQKGDWNHSTIDTGSAAGVFLIRKFNQEIERRHITMAKTSVELDENVAGLLCYVLVWVSGLVFFLIEKKNKFVRFHALQSIIVFGVLFLAIIIIGWIPVIGWVIAWLISVLAIVLWILLMIKAYQGEKFKLPWAGELAEKNA